MLIFFINKIFYIFFILSTLNVIMNLYKFIRAWALSNTDQTTRYKISKKDVLFVGLSLSYIITSLINGITL